MRIPVIVFAALAATATATAAQQPLNQVIPTAATGEVEIVNLAGEVRVVGWDRPEIRVTGTLGQGAERLAVENSQNRTSIRVVVPRNTRNVQGSELEIRVPQRKNVQVRTTSADISVSDVVGSVDAQSTSGDVTVGGGARQTLAKSVSGDVGIRGAHQRVQASTTSGDVSLEGRVQENASVEVVSGDVRLAADVPDLVVKSVSGDVDIGGTVRRVSLGTVSGGVRIGATGVQYLSAETVSGGLLFNGRPANGAAFNLQSHSGEFELALPAALGARFDVSSFSGGITNELGPAAQRTSQYGPGSQLRFTSGEGGALITVKTFSGDVKLRRR